MSTLRTDTLSNAAGTRSIGVDRVAQGTAAAWVNFNGTGTVAIRASYNVSSITDNGVGDYTVNFTNAMPDANYAIAGTSGNGITGFNPRFVTQLVNTASSVRVSTSNAGSVLDDGWVSVAIFR